MTCRNSLQNRCFLPPEKEARRLELYNQGLSDCEIASLVGCSPRGITTWRWKRGLPAHRKFGQQSILDQAEHERRLELYHQGKSDVEIATAVGRTSQSINHWRKQHGLPPHQWRNRIPSGVPMDQVLAPEQCTEMRMFLAALLALCRKLPPGQKLDVTRFMAQWRKLRNQLYPMISNAVEKNLKEKPKGKTQLC